MTPSAFKSHRYFAPLLLLGLLAVSAGGFFILRHMAETSVAQRRELSRKNLERLNVALRATAERNQGSYPGSAEAVVREAALAAEALIHPAWPDQPGYIYVPGGRLDDDPSTIVVFENVPARKSRLPHQILTVAGGIETLETPAFKERLRHQAERWKQAGRRWAPEPLGPRAMDAQRNATPGVK